ncbi:OmpP1/FadL family transporter [Pseudaestuariivita rosea]|uniref:OmpP1/FadL family transporter n=1 Tax=Pseudaestuariivita rosea TaxID=2763263 RepID=UPI001ABB3EB7|nr:outer membrane protein transport protein [Pseudaestuariivita rosea]
MKRVLTTAAVLAAGAGTATAGGIERSTQSVGILFEEGTYAQLGFSRVRPDVEGEQQVTLGAGTLEGSKSGDVIGNYTNFNLAFKTPVNDQVELAFILDQPVGADVNYANDTDYAYGGGLSPLGSSASIDSVGIRAILKYNIDENFSIYGGVQNQRVEGEVSLFTTYEMETDTSSEWGYLVGAAYERPDIALRVALTYHSEITHEFNADETQLGFADASTSFETTVPQSLMLEFQSGVAPDTLVFGSIRWVDWTEFDITPTEYENRIGNSLVDYDDDTITYELGIGRRFTENWAGAVSLGYEGPGGGFSGNLGPTDGFTSVTLAATYTFENVEITGGARYIWIGDAETEAPSALTGGASGVTLGEFEDNYAIAYGLQIGYQF